MSKHNRRCQQPYLSMIVYDKKRNAYMIRLPDAPKPGWNDIYYCPTCGVELEGTGS